MLACYICASLEVSLPLRISTLKVLLMQLVAVLVEMNCHKLQRFLLITDCCCHEKRTL